MAAVKSPKLRAYQRTAIESARRALTKSGSCILQMPTGAGKTRAATEVIASSRGVIWFVCHRQEIERQVAKAFTAAGIDFGIVSPRGKPEYDKRVQIVSVGTLTRRIKELPEPRLVIWDECHHAPAKSWAKLRAKLKSARHLGLTATPERLDGKGLREWFAQLVTGPSIAGLIKKGFLSEFKYYAPSDPDLTAAKLQAGDYRKQDLGKIMNTPVLIGDAVREYKKRAKGKRALAFCASVEASQALAVRFNKDGVKARHIDGTTPTAERDAAVQDLATGKIKVLCNVEVFTEGFDLPAIDAVILMRPTKSPTLLLQMIGRGLRKSSGKDTALIFDHAGLHRDHAWFADDWHWSLDGGAAKARRKAVARGPRRCPECKEVRAERVEVCSCGYEFPTGREIGEFDGVLTEVRGVVPEGCVTQAEFARMVGIAPSTMCRWVRHNEFPSLRLGYVDVALATKFVEQNGFTKNVCAGIGLDRKHYVSKLEFARIIGVKGKNVVSRFADMGMPVGPNGYPLVGESLNWLAEHSGNFRALPPFDVPDRNNYENGRSFARRVGIHESQVTGLKKRGLPCATNGWVHIQRGLEWVRDNTNIKIPASAWPKKAAKSKRNRPPDELRPGL